MNKVIDFLYRPYFWYFRRKHNYPCVYEIVIGLESGPILEKLNDPLLITVHLYLKGIHIKDIAIELDVTRERIRQRLNKIWRISKGSRT